MGFCSNVLPSAGSPSPPTSPPKNPRHAQSRPLKVEGRGLGNERQSSCTYVYVAGLPKSTKLVCILNICQPPYLRSSSMNDGSTEGPASPRHQNSQRKRMEEAKEELICAICTEFLARPRSLACLHSFCESCLHMLSEKTPSRDNTSAISCPECRLQSIIPPEGIEGKVGFADVALQHKICVYCIWGNSRFGRGVVVKWYMLNY